MLLNVSAAPGAPEIVVVTRNPSSRLAYTCDFIFRQVLRCRFRFAAEAIAGEFAIHYGGEAGTGFFISAYGVMSESAIPGHPPQRVAEGKWLLFPVEGGALPFDVFSAVFYMISRAEEWTTADRDLHGRFEARHSILKHAGCLREPVADQWIARLAGALEAHYPQLHLPLRQFAMVSTIDVDNLFAYRKKGLLRTAGAAMRDLLRGDGASFFRRLRVLRGRESDPFDVYGDVTRFCSERSVPLYFFFLLRSGTKFDRSVKPRKGNFEAVVSQLRGAGTSVGLHPSYYSKEETRRLKTEIGLFKEIFGEAPRITRQHYLRFDIASTPGMLAAEGITADFSMGFASEPGFRAGTSHPFRYYDFSGERSLEFTLVPFCAMDGAYTVYENATADKALEDLMALAETVRESGGNFVTVFHERTFDDHLYPGFGALYKKLLDSLPHTG